MGHWLIGSRRGLATALSRLAAATMSAAGIGLIAVATTGLGTASAATNPYSATGSLSDTTVAGITQQVDVGLGYIGGVKEDTVCPDAPQVPVHSNPPKDQITSAWAGSSGPYLYLAWQRASSSGDTAIEFELNQLGQPLCNGVQAPRTAGDILIVWQFSGNVVSQGIVGYVWSGTSWGPQISLGSALVSSGESGNWTFADAVIDIANLPQVLALPSGQCISFLNGFAKSRAGNGNSGTGFTSELKAVLPSIPLDATTCTPNVSVMKSGPDTGTAGQDGVYTMVATNSGNGAATGVVITDTLPTGESYVSSTDAFGTCTASGQVVTCGVGTVAANGGTASVIVTVMYGSGTGGQSLQDCATVAGQAVPSCVTTSIPPPPPTTALTSITLTVTKTNDANGSGTYAQSETATAAGENVPFQVVVTNTSAVAVTISSLTDQWPSQAPFSPTCASAVVGTTLQPGASATCDFTENGYAPAAGTSLTDTASVTGCDSTASTNCGTVQATSTVNTPAPTTSSASGPATKAAGGSLAFTGPPVHLRLILELGFALLSLGCFLLWLTRPRREVIS